MKKITLVAICLTIALTQFSIAQITFEKTYNASGEDLANDVKQTTDGGYIICGVANNGADDDIFLIKTIANGDTLWTRTYGGQGDESGNSVLQTSDGGYIIAGSTNSFGAGSTDAYLVKTDIQGNVEWNKAIGTASGDAAYGIVQTSDGGYVFSGYESASGLDGLSHLVKTDAAGNIVWSKTYGVGSQTNFSFSMLQTLDGGYIIGGYENQFVSNNYDYSLIRTDSAGNLMWYKKIGDADVDRNFTVALSSDGGFVFAGTNFTVSSSEINLVKTDANGDVVWSKNYGGTGNEFAYALASTSDGGYIFGGTSFSFTSNNSAYIVKTDSAGNYEWSKIMQGAGYDIIYAIQQTSDGGYVLAGIKDLVSGVSGDLYLVKTDANGTTGCNQSVSSIVFTPTLIFGDITISANSSPLENTAATVTGSGATVTSVCAVTEVPGLIREENIDIYPNPASTFLVINTMLAEMNYSGLQIVDVAGREMSNWKYERHDSQVIIDISELNSGIYFLKINNTLKKFIKSS